MRIFNFSEAYGPFICENGLCGKDAWDALLTDDENKSLPEPTGLIAASTVLQSSIGVLLCKDCLNERMEQL